MTRTTFIHNTDLYIRLSKMPVNQADKKATRMVVKGIIIADGTITGSLYAGDILLTHRRVYSIKKNMPFVLDERQINKLTEKVEIEKEEVEKHD